MLLVDAAQGIEAQTLANFHLARDAGLVIVPVAEQDRPARRPTSTRPGASSPSSSAATPEDVLAVSGKTGEGVTDAARRE